MILGTLSATGSVYLINLQGIVIGERGVVKTGGRFVASALDKTNAAFISAGALMFAKGCNVFLVARSTVSCRAANLLFQIPGS